MQQDISELKNVRRILQDIPHGLSITELAEEMQIHRTTASKYLEVLQLTGEVDMRMMGAAKVYIPVQRIPATTIRSFSEETVILLSSRLYIREIFNDLPPAFGNADDMLEKPLHETDLLSILGQDLVTRCREAALGKRSFLDLSCKNAGKRWYYSIRILPVVYEEGRAGVGIFIKDETICREAQSAAEVASEVQSALSQEQTEFMFRCKPDSTLTYVNDAFCRRLERKPHELIGFTYEPVISPDEMKRLTDERGGITPERPVIHISFKAILPDGTVSWEEWTYRGIFTNKQILVEFIAVGKDISRIHHLEDQLQAYHTNFENLVKQRTREMQLANQNLIAEISRRERLEKELLIVQAAFDHASDSIILFERTGTVWRANETSLNLLGYQRDEMYNVTVFDINPEITPDDWNMMWDKNTEQSCATRVSSIHQRKDGTIIPVEVSRTFIQAGPTTLFCSIARQVGPANPQATCDSCTQD